MGDVASSRAHARSRARRHARCRNRSHPAGRHARAPVSSPCTSPNEAMPSPCSPRCSRSQARGRASRHSGRLWHWPAALLLLGLALEGLLVRRTVIRADIETAARALLGREQGAAFAFRNQSNRNRHDPVRNRGASRVRICRADSRSARSARWHRARSHFSAAGAARRAAVAAACPRAFWGASGSRGGRRTLRSANADPGCARYIARSSPPAQRQDHWNASASHSGRRLRAASAARLRPGRSARAHRLEGHGSHAAPGHARVQLKTSISTCS